MHTVFRNNRARAAFVCTQPQIYSFHNVLQTTPPSSSTYIITPAANFLLLLFMGSTSQFLAIPPPSSSIHDMMYACKQVYVCWLYYCIFLIYVHRPPQLSLQPLQCLQNFKYLYYLLPVFF